jgi:hypothetical protein
MDAKHRGRVRGSIEWRETSHPARTASVPPSPTRGEGRKSSVAGCATLASTSQRVIPAKARTHMPCRFVFADAVDPFVESIGIGGYGSRLKAGTTMDLWPSKPRSRARYCGGTSKLTVWLSITRCVGSASSTSTLCGPGLRPTTIRVWPLASSKCQGASSTVT